MCCDDALFDFLSFFPFPRFPTPAWVDGQTLHRLSFALMASAPMRAEKLNSAGTAEPGRRNRDRPGGGVQYDG